MEDKPKKYCDGIDCAFCSEKEPCIYKIANRLESELQHKEQECEELKGKLKYIRDENVHLKESATDEQMDFLTLNNYIKTLEFQLDQLKAENDKYSFFIEKLCDYIGLECDSEEQAMRTLSDFARQMNKARWVIDRYKQTLTEIKEIAEERNYLDYNKCLDDILQKSERWKNE